MREIGGYLEFEELNHQEYYPDLYKCNLGRTALLYLLQALNCKKLRVPYFLCDSVPNTCKDAGISLNCYSISQEFDPLLDSDLDDDEYLYLVNYYGQLTDEKIRTFHKRYTRIIVDHTHSFFQHPLPGIHTLYSCRKFFGVTDGAYLSTDIKLPAIPEIDMSYNRFLHVLGRYEQNASSFYQVMLDHAHSYERATLKRMSKLTENLLGALNYSSILEKRNTNYRTLHAQLQNFNTMNFLIPDGPIAYPLHVRNGAALRKALAAKQIYVPTYWSNVITGMPEDSIEYDYASNILPLPCDQRYLPKDMDYVAACVIDHLSCERL